MADNALQTSKSIPDPPPIKIDKRTKNGKKLDISQVIKLRDINGLSFAEIGKTLDYSEPYIYRTYEKFKGLIQDTDTIKIFEDNRIKFLSSIEMNMLQDLTSETKREKASLNNVAYAFNQIHTARRLEQGLSTGNVAISIETVYQDAEKEAKALRKEHGKVEVSVNSEDLD